MKFIRYFCASCGQKFKTQEEYAGQMVICAKCGVQLEVPKYEIIPVYPVENQESLTHAKSLADESKDKLQSDIFNPALKQEENHAGSTLSPIMLDQTETNNNCPVKNYSTIEEWFEQKTVSDTTNPKKVDIVADNQAQKNSSPKNNAATTNLLFEKNSDSNNEDRIVYKNISTKKSCKKTLNSTHIFLLSAVIILLSAISIFIYNALPDAKLLREHKSKFDEFMAIGYQFINRKDFVSAENAFNAAIKVPGYENHKEAHSNLDYCVETKKKNMNLFNSSINQGLAEMSAKNYETALDFFEKAIKIPGYENNDNAVQSYNQAKNYLAKKKEFDKLMLDGNNALAEKDWKNAKNAFKKALAVPGYTEDSTAISLLNDTNNAHCNAEYTKAYDEAYEYYQQGKTLNNTALSHQKCRDAIKTIINFQESVYYPNVANNAKDKLSSLKTQIEAYIKTIHNDYSEDKNETPTEPSPTIAAPRKNHVKIIKPQSKVSPNNDWSVPDLGTQFVYVATRNFLMGSNRSYNKGDEKPQHWVKIKNNYWIGKHEVTQSEYESILGEKPSYFKSLNSGQRPVENVSWYDAVIFCQELTLRGRDDGSLPPGYEYRLPTESEWEFAARGGNKSNNYLYSGSTKHEAVAWHTDDSGSKTNDVGKKGANELGIHDMSGNVFEWCIDYYHKNYERTPVDGSPMLIESPTRVQRGGGYRTPDPQVTVRFNAYTYVKSDRCGFRVVLGRIINFDNKVKQSLIDERKKKKLKPFFE
jgi:sulfatase modifying factor 1